MKPIIKLEDWTKQNQERLNQIPPRLRPRVKDKPISMRRPSEARALAFAMKHNIEEAERTGYIVKTSGGYKMRWEEEKI